MRFHGVWHDTHGNVTKTIARVDPMGHIYVEGGNNNTRGAQNSDRKLVVRKHAPQKVYFPNVEINGEHIVTLSLASYDENADIVSEILPEPLDQPLYFEGVFICTGTILDDHGGAWKFSPLSVEKWNQCQRHWRPYDEAIEATRRQVGKITLPSSFHKIVDDSSTRASTGGAGPAKPMSAYMRKKAALAKQAEKKKDEERKRKRLEDEEEDDDDDDDEENITDPVPLRRSKRKIAPRLRTSTHDEDDDDDDDDPFASSSGSDDHNGSDDVDVDIDDDNDDVEEFLDDVENDDDEVEIDDINVSDDED